MYEGYSGGTWATDYEGISITDVFSALLVFIMKPNKNLMIFFSMIYCSPS